MVTVESGALLCVFCGARLHAELCVWVRLVDGSDFVCCPVACAALVRQVAKRRRERIGVAG